MLQLARGQLLDCFSTLLPSSVLIYLETSDSSLLSSFHHVANKEYKRLESSYSGRTVVLF